MILLNVTGFISVRQGLVVECGPYPPFSPSLLGLRDNEMSDRKAYNAEHPSLELVKEKSLGKMI